MNAARIELDALVGTSDSELADAFVVFATAVGAPNVAIGSAVADDAQPSIGLIGDVCGANQTPVVIKAEFGG